jgi:hypothetical protein
MDNNYNRVILDERFSIAFCSFLTKSFDLLDKSIFDKRIVQKYIKAYYVAHDLQSGISLTEIDTERLNHFQSVLWGYCINNEADELSKKLLEIVDKELAKRLQ